MPSLTVAIDETGDEGFKFPPNFVGNQGSSRWFVIAAVLVPIEHEPQVAASINRIKARLWPDVQRQHQKILHWRELSHKQKRVVLAELRPEPFEWMAVAIEKAHPNLDRTKFDARLVRKVRPDLKTPLYNWTVRLLFERLTRIAKDRNRTLDVTFENRASLSIPDVKAYLKMLETYPGPYGTPTIISVVSNVTAKNKGASKMLQIADVCAGVLGNALEPDAYGQTEDSYLMSLAPKLRRQDGKLWGYGLKLFPDTNQACMRRIGEPYSWMGDL